MTHDASDQTEHSTAQGDGYDTDPHVRPARYLTADVEPVGGELKQRPEDFIVEELPLYLPSGKGEHLYLTIEKRGMSTTELIAIVARHFGVRRGAIGFAGLKDKHAVTRQTLSVHVPGKKPEDFPMLEHDKARVLGAQLHDNKLRRGHLAGNRFVIYLRDVDQMSGVLRAKLVLDRLARVGVPNRLGVQRFGATKTNHLVGRAVLLGAYEEAVKLLVGPNPEAPEAQAEARERYAAADYDGAYALMPRRYAAERSLLRGLASGLYPRDAWYEIEPTARGFYISGFQSAVFNAVLDARLEANALDELLLGDIAMALPGRNTFVIDPETLANPETTERLERFEIAATGPMWGGSMRRASGEVDALEVGMLRRFGVTPEEIAASNAADEEMYGGDRRPLRVAVRHHEVEGGVDDHGAYVRCAFELPRGAFATTVMDEIMKTGGGV